jgi:hypothetical protein
MRVPASTSYIAGSGLYSFYSFYSFYRPLTVYKASALRFGIAVSHALPTVGTTAPGAPRGTPGTAC